MRFSKKLLLKFIPGFVLIPCLSIAQDTISAKKKFRFEAGFNPGACFRLQVRSVEIFQVVDYFPELFFKFHINKNSIRSFIDFDYKQVHDLYDGSIYYHKIDGKYSGYSVSAGYERKFGKRRVTFSAFLDASFKYSTEVGLSSSCGCFGCYTDKPYHTLRKTFLISTGTGVYYRCAANWRLIYELTVLHGVSYSKNLKAAELITYKRRLYLPHYNLIRTLGVSYMF